MPLSVNEELRRTFERAALTKEAAVAQSPRQWREINDLKTRCADARTREHDLYAKRYESRVEARHRQLIDDAGTRTRVLKPMFSGADRFNPADLLRQAQRDVRAAHSRGLVRIDDYERGKQAEMLERFGAEKRLSGMAREAFGRSADRRSRPRGG